MHAALRTWRAERARAGGVPAYAVFTDATLEAIADRAPTQVGQLVGVAGVGAVKLDRYGPEVVGAVAAALSADRAGGSPEASATGAGTAPGTRGKSLR